MNEADMMERTFKTDVGRIAGDTLMLVVVTIVVVCMFAPTGPG